MKLMDPITQILLTVGLNALVTGVFVYLFQKRVERNAFKEQTKFTRSHEKRAETLEALYPKFRIFSDQLNKLLENAFIEKNEFAADPEILAAIRKNFADSREYLEDNRIFLDTKEAYEIQQIHESFWRIQQVIKLLYVDPYNITNEQILRANRLIGDIPGLQPLEPHDPKYVKLALEIYNQTKGLVDKVEKIYRKIH